MGLTDRLKENRDSGIYPFHMPGHKRICADDEIFAGVYGIDVTETEGLDNLHDAHGIIKEAEERAAKCFGADETHFLVNGSTCGILAAVYASVREGDHIVIAANCHRSVYNAVMLSGATPYIITPERESYFDIYGGIDPEDVLDALTQIENSAGKQTAGDEISGSSHKVNTAVVITSPTYEGITSDIRKIAETCHEKGAVLIVDAAHGAHFGISDKFPESAAEYADIVITSVHKTLPAMTQTALIHIKSSCPVKERVRRMLPVFMSSSPSYVLMASIDKMTEMLEADGKQLFEAYTGRLEEFYKKAEEFTALSVLTQEKLTAKGSAGHDMGRIVMSDMTGTYTGRQLSDILLKEYKICPEMAAGTYVTFITGIADTDEGFSHLTDALSDMDARISGAQTRVRSRGIFRKLYDRVIGRRIAKSMAGRFEDTVVSVEKAAGRFEENRIKEALFNEDTELIPVELAEGRIAKDFVSIYPPGIPVAIPGRSLSGADVDRILEAVKCGLDITGLENGEIAVLWERSSI